MKACYLILLSVILAACAAPQWGSVNPSNETETPAIGFPIETHTIPPTVTVFSVPTSTATLIPTQVEPTPFLPENWQEWPVVPTVQPEMKAIYLRGIESGNNPRAFSKIGDGEVSTAWFLTQYDLSPEHYQLGPYSDLQSVIDKYSGSFGHVGVAAGRGFNTTIILGLAPSDIPGCTPGETRLDCELQTYRPSLAIISLGTNQVWQPEIFEPELRKIIDRLLESGVVPILSTKADNLEGNYLINRIIAKLAYEYKLPLWNFWLAVQPLPEHGLQADHEHLTYADSDFSKPDAFQYAWPNRNLTALQVLDSVDRALSSRP
jgi:hypothetical protein